MRGAFNSLTQRFAGGTGCGAADARKQLGQLSCDSKGSPLVLLAVLRRVLAGAGLLERHSREEQRLSGTGLALALPLERPRYGVEDGALRLGTHDVALDREQGGAGRRRRRLRRREVDADKNREQRQPCPSASGPAAAPVLAHGVHVLGQALVAGPAPVLSSSAAGLYHPVSKAPCQPNDGLWYVCMSHVKFARACAGVVARQGHKRFNVRHRP